MGYDWFTKYLEDVDVDEDDRRFLDELAAENETDGVARRRAQVRLVR